MMENKISYKRQIAAIAVAVIALALLALPRCCSGGKDAALNEAYEGSISVTLCSYDASSGSAAEAATDELLEDFSALMPGGAPWGEDMADLAGVAEFLKGNIDGEEIFGGAKAFFLTLLLITLIFALLEVLVPDGELGSTASVALTVLLSLPMFATLAPLFGEVAEGIQTSGEFFGGLIPIATGVMLAGGAAETGAAVGGGFGFALAFVGSIITELLLPLSFIVLLMTFAEGMDRGGVGAVVSAVKKHYVLVLGLVTTLIIGVFALQTSFCAAADTMAMRGAKYAISNMVPVVGGVISGTLSVLRAGVGYAVGAVGMGAVITLLAIYAAPFLTTLLYRLGFTMALLFADLLGVRSGKRILTSFAGALDTLIALQGVAIVIYVAESVIFIKLGGIFG